MAHVAQPVSGTSRTTPGLPSPYVEFDRAAWSRLRENHPLNLDDADLSRLRGLGDRIDLREVEDVYLPLSRLLNFYVGATRQLHAVTSDFLGERPAPTPFVIGVAGSVAVGKSPTRRGSPSSRPTASSCPRLSSRAGGCCSARVFPSPTTVGP